MLTHGLGTLRATRLLQYVLCHLWQDGGIGGDQRLSRGWQGMGLEGLPPKAGREEELPLRLWAGGGSPRGFSGLFLEAPGQDLLLLLEARLNAGSVMCSNSVNKYNSSHRENLVFPVNSASKQRHRFVFYSLTRFIILRFNRLPPGPRDAFFSGGYSQLPTVPPRRWLLVKRMQDGLV